MAYVPLDQFAPDASSDTEGIIIDCAAMIASKQGGYMGAPSAVDVGADALESPVFSAVSLARLDLATRTFAATQTKLFERAAQTWINQSGGSYTGSPTSLWRFAQFGNLSLATNKIDPIQKSDSALFSNLGGSPPKAALIDTVLGFVVLADTDDALFGDSPDRWWCSAIFNPESWAPSIATQCATARLLEPAGPITASRRLGDNWVIYKRGGLYLGTYVGPPFIWNFTLISDTSGALSQEAVLNIGTAHVFVGFDDIYLFDGSRPQSITGPIKQWFLKRTKSIRPLKINLVWSRRETSVYFFYSSAASPAGAIDECIVWNYETNKWGRDDRFIETAFESIAPGTIYDEAGNFYLTYDDFPSNLAYDNFLFSNEYPEPAIFATDHRLKILTGTTVSSSMDLWDLGDDINKFTLKRLRPRFTVKPVSGVLNNFYREHLGDGLSTGPSSNLVASRFDLMKSARWHRNRISFSGNVSVLGIDIDARPGATW